jgi:16S rRNA (guanine966-N2)-methyltransferase
MRIIAGQRRGHKIDGPRASGQTKPTSDMVRESIFNIVRELVVDRLVIDLFAGTGALGLEALSRGAQRAIFVEKDRENVSLIIKNIATLRYEDRAQVKLIDAYRWVSSFEPPVDEPIAIFLDPPYRDYQLKPRRVNQLIVQLVGRLAPGSVIALEAGQKLDRTILHDFESWDIRRYGDTRIAILMVTDSVRANVEIARAPTTSSGETEAAERPGDDRDE